MNILFLTIGKIDTFDTSGSIYTDLVRKFRDEGHNVFVVHSLEKRHNQQTIFEEYENVKFLRVRTGNITKTSFLEKGISTLFLEYQYIKAIKKYLYSESFDLILYSTPPITFNSVIKYIKKRDNALSYLLLKDIFPQNAVDLGLFKKHSIINMYFRYKEKKLYRNSDVIGCMSKANVNYIIQNNKIEKEKIEVNPNSVQIIEYKELELASKVKLKKKYKIPQDKKIFLYGGNLGKPQGIDFLVKIIKNNENSTENFILIIGSGTEYEKIDNYISSHDITNTMLINYLPRKEYNMFLNIADVGLIFLDYRFTIPNFPSRLLAYLQNKLPILAATDENSDLKDAIEDGKFGFWVPSNDDLAFMNAMEKFSDLNNNKILGDNGYRYLKENYDVEVTYNTIMRHF